MTRSAGQPRSPGAAPGASRGIGTLAVCVLTAATCAGCAVGRITASGDMIGAALGRARLEHCEPPPASPVVVVYGAVTTPTPTPARRRTRAVGECRRITGGSLSGGAADALEAALSGLAAYFGMGG